MQLAWWIVLLTVPAAVAVGVNKAARRLLPLAALCKLSLVFPDHAPSRLGVAMRAGTVRQLEERIEHARHDGLGGTPTEAARYLLELVGALGIHDRRTRGHAERVRALADLLADELKLSSDDRERLHWAALVHDIGKIAVPHEILNKAGAPDDAEWEQLKKHPIEGERMAAPLAAWLGEWVMAIGQHHERWDGKGYPRGLAGTEISLAARIVGVADSFEVMTAARSYKRPMPAAAARAELTNCAGTQFDPAIVRAFMNISIGKLRWAMGPLSWLAQLPVSPRFREATTNVLSGAGRTATVAVAATGLAVSAVTSTVVSLPPSTEPVVSRDVAAATTQAPAPRQVTPGPERPPVAPEPTSTTAPAPTTTAPAPTTTTAVVPTTPKTTAAAPVPSAPTTPAPTAPAPTTPATAPVSTPAPATLPATAPPSTSCPILTKDQRGKDLSGVDLRCNADMHGFDFTGANLAGADLSGADLTKTNFNNADLTDAKLVGAKLKEASFEGADLTGATLLNATIGGIKTRNAVFSATICPDGVSSDAKGGHC